MYDETGLLREILSKYRGEEKVDRKIAREYDALDRLIKVTYDGRDVETYSYDSWGKVISSSRNGRKASYRYDYFGRLVEKNEDGVITRSSYNAWGQRTGRETVNGSLKLTETREYDALGRLSKIRNGSGGELTCHYDNLNRLVKQTVNGVPVEYSYDKYGRLVRKALMGFSGSPAVSELKYFYDPDGTIIAREVNGVRQAYKYDRRGQLLEVVGQERYAYDPAGNILSKTVNGVTTTYRYDRANQLVSSETEGKVTKYAYDAAGRLIKEGNKSYTYAWLDKLVSVSEAGKVSANFSYHFDGQIAGVTYADGRRENYLWDGLALIHRDGTELLNEPAVTGGNPVLSGDKVLFNDMLGNTLGVKGKDAYQPIKMTAFGESDNVDAFFTGKPLVGELGYAFLFRNYRPEQGKWQTADPLGYPEGWNNFAYVNNAVSMNIDWLGAAKKIIINASGAGTSGSIGGGSSGGSGSSSGGWGHSWFDLDDGNGNISGHGFYPEDPAGWESVSGKEYGHTFSDNDTQQYRDAGIPYASLEIELTDEQYQAVLDYINNYAEDWSLYNNCTDYVMDALEAAGIDTSNYDYTTAGVADPDKLRDAILANGGRLIE